MRVLAFIFLVALASPAATQLALPSTEDDRAPSRLAPIDPGSRWYERLETAGLAVGSALSDGPSGAWAEYFGGRWLSAADRAYIAVLLANERTALRRVLVSSGAYEQAVLGWQPPDGSAAYAALADRPEADAVICWRAYGSEAAWPTTALEAEDRQRHACVRLVYSIRFDPPQWRAFIDAPVSGAD
ncbi:MAG: hypothetical protein H2056_03770 [Sphingopyxis sp.]|nr:hypothetical protein [Sphingopyxis sp.]